jgi:putative transposase
VALTDEPGAIVAPMLPPATQSPRGGCPRPVDRRAGLPTICSLHRSGGQGAMLPHDGLPKRPVSDAVVQWRDDGTWAGVVQAWRERHRVAAGREPTPRAAGSDSHAVKTTALGGPERGYEGGKTVTGRKRPVLVETLGLWRALVITGAGLEAGVAARPGLGHVTPQDCPRLGTICADQKSHHHDLEAWRVEHRVGWRSAVKTRPAGTKGLTPLEKRWGIERTNAWQGRYRSNSQDCERNVESSTARLQIRTIHLMRNPLAPGGRPAFHDRKQTA